MPDSFGRGEVKGSKQSRVGLYNISSSTAKTQVSQYQAVAV